MTLRLSLFRDYLQLKGMHMGAVLMGGGLVMINFMCQLGWVTVFRDVLKG